MPLSGAAIRNAKPGDKPQTMTDERGLSIQIQPNGGKWWRFRYRFAGKAKMLSLVLEKNDHLDALLCEVRGVYLKIATLGRQRHHSDLQRLAKRANHGADWIR